MKKLMTIFGLVAALMLTGVAVNAACNGGSLKSGIPGTCTAGEPLVEYVSVTDPDTGMQVMVNVVITPGEWWCDLNTVGASCWVSIYPQ